MPKSDREVFEHLSANDTLSLEIKFLTYALFAHEKSEWMKHWESRKGVPPTQAEIDEWISNITDHQLRGMTDKAIDFFDNAARVYLADEIADAREEVLNAAIIGQVRAASSFWKQLAMALTTAILAPLILGGIIAAALLSGKLWTPSEIAAKIHQEAPQPPPVPAK